MDEIQKLISSAELKGFSDYLSIYKKIEKIKPKNKKTLKIAILPSFTIKGFKEVLSIKCLQFGITPEFYISDYGKYVYEILNEKSGLYKFNPDLIIFFIDTKTITGETYSLPYEISDEERLDWVNEKHNEIKSWVEKIKENSSAKIIMHNFEVPLYSPFGILENKQKFGFFKSIKELNNHLEDDFKDDSQVFIFDYDAFCSKTGKEKIIDYKMYFLGDVKLSFENVPNLCEEYLAYIKPLTSTNRKCLVLDLDNTLWGGIIGEDGLKGIKLGPTPEGRPFLEFQKIILSLFKRGIILAVNSKNNLEDVLEVFRKHPHMILKEEHFASMQINWNDKISNMKTIAKEINIGLDSLVFLDDDKLNREMVRSELPEVLVINLPEDFSLYPKTLQEIDDFNTLQITEEDKKKGSMYVQQRKRQEFEQSATDVSDYLKKLEMTAVIEKANSFNIPRISQLTQKTNQFNLTTRRYTEEDITKFSKDGNHLVISINVKDKFGDNGIVGTAIVKKGKKEWEIDTFLLSCRVIGRKVEETLLFYIFEQAKKEKIQEIKAEFIPTKKNAPAKDFYKNNNFELSSSDNSKEIWKFNLSKEFEKPEFIKVILAG